MKQTLTSTIARAFTATSLLATLCLCPAQGLLFSDSFQSGQGDWTLTGGAWLEQASGPNFTPTYGNWALNTPAKDGGGTSSGYRTFTGAAPGMQYQWSGHIHQSANFGVSDGVLGFAVIQFLGATGDIPIGSEQTDPLRPNPGAWDSFTVSGTAPDGTERVRFLLQTVTPEGSGYGSLYYDAVQADITAVPEPTAFWALPVLLAAIAGRHAFRRRKAD